jgi:TubC N-terminal docking domain
MNAEALLTEFRARGIRVEPRPDGRLRLTPKDRLTPELIEQARRLKPEILNRLQIDQALAAVGRLKALILPAGRMPAARAIVELLKPLLDSPDIDPPETLACLQAVESELIAMGAEPDPELAETLAMVQRTFPAAKFVEIRRRQ